MLTEAGAGVLSGLVVETTATWTPEGTTWSHPAPLIFFRLSIEQPSAN